MLVDVCWGLFCALGHGACYIQMRVAGCLVGKLSCVGRGLFVPCLGVDVGYSTSVMHFVVREIPHL